MTSLLEQIQPPENSATIIDRIKYLQLLSRKSQIGFGKLVGIDPSSLSKILTGRMNAGESFINRIVVNLGVSKEWLTKGVGVPFPKTGMMPTQTAQQSDVNSAAKGAPVYNIEASAGPTPITRAFTRENIIGYLDVPGIDPRNPLVRVTGDSMVPTIPNGSFISIREIVDPSVIYWGAIYLVQLEDYRMVKMVRRHDDPEKLILHSANPDYDDIEVDRRQVVKLFLVENVINWSSLA